MSPLPPHRSPAPAPDGPADPDHAIRLRGPWGWTPDGGGEITVSLPHAAATAGTLRRRFNAPTGLGDGTRVRLRLDASAGATATLNAAPAGDDADVTDRLGPAGSRCVLEVAVPAGGRVDAAALALFEPVYEY